MNIVLKEYYKYYNKTFEMPQAMRGDYKNDGWVIEDKKFFMMYSPVITKKSFYNDIQEKLESDLKGLLKNIYKENMWDGELKEAILLVNTRDGRLPPNNTREYEKIIQKYKNLYNINFECCVANLDIIETMLGEMPSEELDYIIFKLNMARSIDYNEPNATDIISTIGNISRCVMESYTKNLSSDYKRISTSKKIKINNLEEIKEDIEQIIRKLSVVEKAVLEMSQDIESLEQFECTKNYIIKIYIDNYNNCSGVELFNLIIQKVSELFSNYDNRINEIKYLVVYIFDKCDIFEKEAV